ncbi:hypothetical protein DERP_002856 [Dermatophagoides pteronyssinus]|uniref:Uncharacterized protein n=1 Tax=Dermatophagoides pteronyssinus TaxID=6956 RepID=A0ABQ8JVV0_DERPT|nr:hypothetical protein DERP_002856 [Dermatophagoides pteronyssinus]
MFGKLNFFFIVFKYLKIDFQNFQNLKKFKRVPSTENFSKETLVVQINGYKQLKSVSRSQSSIDDQPSA